MAVHADRRVCASRKYFPHPRFPDEVDPDELPDVYASNGEGDCLEPVFRDGTTFVFSKIERPRAGDYVGMWLKPETVRHGESPRMIMRLVFDLAPWLTFPTRSRADDGPTIDLQMLTPPRQIAMAASRIVALHKIIAVAKSNGDGTSRLIPIVSKGDMWS